MYLRWAPLWTEWIFDDDFNDTTSVAWKPALLNSTAPDFGQFSDWRYGTTCGNNGVSVPALNLVVSGCTILPLFDVVSPNFSCPSHFNIIGTYLYEGVLNGKSYWKHSNQSMYLRWAPMWTQWIFDNDFVDTTSVAWTPFSQTSTLPPNATVVWYYGSTCGNNGCFVPALDIFSDTETQGPTGAPTSRAPTAPTTNPTSRAPTAVAASSAVGSSNFVSSGVLAMLWSMA